MKSTFFQIVAAGADDEIEEIKITKQEPTKKPSDSILGNGGDESAWKSQLLISPGKLPFFKCAMLCVHIAQ